MASRSSIVSVAYGLWAGRPRVRILAGARDLSFLHNVQIGSEDNHTFRCTGVLSQTYGMWDMKLTTHLHLLLKFRRVVLYLHTPYMPYGVDKKALQLKILYNSKTVDDSLNVRTVQ